MNGKQAKALRRLARGLTTVHGAEMVGDTRTKRIRTSASGQKTMTISMMHPEGSYRRILRSLKRAKPTAIDIEARGLFA